MTVLREHYRITSHPNALLAIEYTSTNKTALGEVNLGRTIWLERANAAWVSAAIGAVLEQNEAFVTRVQLGPDALHVYESGPYAGMFVHISNERTFEPHHGTFWVSMLAPLATQLMSELAAISPHDQR